MQNGSTAMPPQRFILAEMVKNSHLDIGLLVEFIKSHGVQPDWLSMQLPGGRSRWLSDAQGFKPLAVL
jgi:hypothetical protein